MQIKLDRVPVVARRPLEVHAIGENLMIDLRGERLESARPPSRRRVELRERRADVQKPERLAGEMRVRTVVNGVEALDVPRMVPQLPEKLAEQRVVPYGGVAGELPAPAPRDATERDLEAAHPIHADSRRILPHPRREQSRDCLRVRGVACQMIRLRQPHQLLVSVQLPNELHVSAGLAVHVLHAVPTLGGRFMRRDRVRAPVDLSDIDGDAVSKDFPLAASQSVSVRE